MPLATRRGRSIVATKVVNLPQFVAPWPEMSRDAKVSLLAGALQKCKRERDTAFRGQQGVRAIRLWISDSIFQRAAPPPASSGGR
ncbi:protein of unknown function [Hyphomicrobium sp. 1Nfss2.1]